MLHRSIIFAALFVISAALPANIGFAQVPASNPDSAAVRAVLDAQQAAWNRGDIQAFMQGYEDSPETAFVSTHGVERGFQLILDRYRKAYATQEQMGQLTFSDLDIRLLPSANGAVEYAIVTGRFHLDRTTHGTARQDDGVYSLLFHKSANGWKILLDHTA
jgi:ketosteroid isomerase-like protein